MVCTRTVNGRTLFFLVQQSRRPLASARSLQLAYIETFRPITESEAYTVENLYYCLIAAASLYS